MTDDILWKNIEALKQERSQPSGYKQPRAASRSPASKPAPSPNANVRESQLAGKPAIWLDSKPPIRHASTLARCRDSTIETIRKTVKQTGREAAFLRLTNDEKRQLADLVYAFRRQGLKTTENEVVRIALNYLLLDHGESGKESVLERVLAALNA